MKKIFKLMLLPAMVLPLLFTSCSDDNDSNPTLDLSHVADGFVLNQPAYADNNTYDLASASSLTLSCSQPNYGGAPYVVRYYVQVSLDEKFLTDTTTTHAELATSYTTAKMSVDAAELNTKLVDMFQAANPDTSVPESMPVYIRLRAVIDGTADPYLGQTYSNIITLPSVKATYVAPDAEYPETLFVVGSSIQDAWNSWKPVPPVYGLKGNYYTMIYVPDDGSFKWGTAVGDWRGYSRFTNIDDQAGAGFSEDSDGNLKVEKGGWYTLLFAGELSADKKNINYNLTVYPAAAYIIGAAAGDDWTDGNAAWAMTAPADQTGEWTSPTFTGDGELRAYIKIPGIDWWRTEYTIVSGKCYWRNVDISDNWANPQTNHFTGYMYLDRDGFKFSTQPDWNGTSYGENFSTAPDAGNIMMSEAPGYYKVDVDLSTKTYSLTPITTIGIIGDATADGWNSDQDMTYNQAERCWEIKDITLKASTIKFRANHGWDINWGGTVDNLTQGGSDIEVDAGTYDIKLYAWANGYAKCEMIKK